MNRKIFSSIYWILDRLIKPAPIIYNRVGLKAKNIVFEDIFTGSHHFFLKVHGHDWILAGGLNNFHQLGKIFSKWILLKISSINVLGLAQDEPLFFPTFIPSLEGKKWMKFSGGLHHTLGLTAEGTVIFSIDCLLFSVNFNHVIQVKFMQWVVVMKGNSVLIN